MLKHPIKIGLTVEFNAKRCNCTFVRKDIRTAKILTVRNFNGKYWYGLSNGTQIGQEKILNVVA